MPLLFDRRTELGNSPGTHALVVGVSDYEFLPSHDKEADPVFGLRGLASGALTAYRVAEWLLKSKDRLAAPLATLRLLVAPSARDWTERRVQFTLPPLESRRVNSVASCPADTSSFVTRRSASYSR